MTPKLNLGLLEVERTRKGCDRPFRWVFALSKESRRPEVRVVQQLFQRAHRHRRNICLIEHLQPLVRGAVFKQCSKNLI